MGIRGWLACRPGHSSGLPRQHGRYATNRLPPHRPGSTRPPSPRTRPSARRRAIRRRPLPSRGSRARLPPPRRCPQHRQPDPGARQATPLAWRATVIWDGLPAYRSRVLRHRYAASGSGRSSSRCACLCVRAQPGRGAVGQPQGMELANLTGDTLDEVTAAAERGIQRIRRTHHLAYSFLRHCGLPPLVIMSPEQANLFNRRKRTSGSLDTLVAKRDDWTSGAGLSEYRTWSGVDEEEERKGSDHLLRENPGTL
jgi:hypothetical protein